MNKALFSIALFLLLYSCLGKHDSNAQKAIVEERTMQSVDQSGDTLQIDLLKSNIHWKGTKMRGAGKHEGAVELKRGYFLSENGRLVGGNFVVDMSTITVTDIPKSNPIPIRNINEHLKSSDFFNVEKFPTSEFQITSMKQMPLDSLVISGNLTLKNSTKNITFGAKYQHNKFSSRFTINRFHWNIAYEGSWADKTMVDKNIEMKILVKTK